MKIKQPAERSAMRGLACAAALAAVGGVGLAGCGQFRQPEQVLNPQSFIAQTPPVGIRRGQGAGNPLLQPSDTLYDQVHLELLDQGQPNDISPGQVSRIIQEQVRLPSQAVAEGASGPPATQPAQTQPAPQAQTQPAVDVSGQYQIIGSVLAEVNGKPIYADQVLHALDKVLRSQARQYDAEQFRERAADLIDRQVHEYINAELEFAAADHNLVPKDKDLAKAQTVIWRQQQIAQAGGSVELAKRRAAEDGLDFEDEVNQHYRLLMTQLYYQRHIFPLIRVTPRDMREYYDSHQKDFTQYPAAQFRVIQINVGSTGSVDAAFKKIEAIRDKAAAGDDFAKLATRYNDDPTLQANAGYPVAGGWVDKGAYNVESVEGAVWKLQPGQITSPIRDGDSFYLAKLEQLKRGSTQPFESETVQDAIRESLRRMQFTELRNNQQLALEQQAIITTNPDMIDLSLDMVMQQYPYWIEKK
jgi:parvulin-like peptidyl-prolyl isomerase